MKKTLFLILTLVLLLSLVPGALAAEGVPAVYIDGQPFTGAVLEIEDTTYVALRAFCETLTDADVSWENAAQTARVRGDGLDISVRAGAKYMEFGGRAAWLPHGCRLVDGRIMVPIRPLCKALGCSVTWDGESYSVYVESGSPLPETGDSFYDEGAVYWLSRIISAESGGEPLEGQIAVGNVVLNRVADKDFPNTIYGVIFDRRHGIQFSPVYYGTVYNKPYPLSVIAAKLCLEGCSTAGESMYFLNPRLASSAWFDKHLTPTCVIGNHSFYA